MRLFHIADLHLGKTLHGWDLLEDQAFILDGVVAKIGAMRPDVLLVAGDVYDRAIPPVEAIRLFDDFLGKARRAAPGLQIVVVPGNHDSAVRLSFGASLLADSGLHIVDHVALTRKAESGSLAPRVVAAPILVSGEGKGRTEIWALPFLTQSSAEWGELAPAGSGAAIRSQQEMMELALHAIREAMDPGVTNILVAHFFTSGALAGDSELAFVGATEQVDVRLFEGFDYVALGHLHSCQSPAPRVWYSGAPLAYSVDDNTEGAAGVSLPDAGKGFLAVDVAVGEAPHVEFVPLVPKRRLRRLSGLFDELLANLLPEDERDDFIEVHILDDEAVLNAAERLRVMYPHLLGATQRAFELRWGAAGAGTGFAGAGSAGMEALRRARGAGSVADRVDTVKSDFIAFYGEMTGQAPGEAMERLFESMAREASDASD